MANVIEATQTEHTRPAPVVTAWDQADRRSGKNRATRWRQLLWSLIYPQRGQRILPTVPGVFLILVALGIGGAAYNTSNNILFITLSLLLACLIFSGVLSWLNFKAVEWRLRVLTPLRVGQEHAITLELRNGKRVLPTYGLWFDFAVSDLAKPVRRAQGARLDAGGEGVVEWSFRPARRGALTVELTAVGSLFPFGFLKKSIGAEVKREVLVWPEPVAYRHFTTVAWRKPGEGGQGARVGEGGELRSLRPYVEGDSHRRVHWKASARLGRVMVKQHAAEMQAGFALWVQTSATMWTRPEQFELLCRFAATLAEDLFRAGRLVSVAVDAGPTRLVRRGVDLEHFLDEVAQLAPSAALYPDRATPGCGRERGNVMTFVPEGARGVAAYVDGIKTASA
jgi:uncharacterized protein (DUF58 family)